VQVHLVDGTFELFRAYYSAPSRRNEDGREVGASLGWFRCLTRVLQGERATHVAVAFDPTIESGR
jgi:5'-3' exonuclease